MMQLDEHGREACSTTPDRLSELLQRRLSAYALSVGAAGVAVLACSAVAAAAPVCKHSSAIVTGTFPLSPAGQPVAPFDIAQTFNNVSSMSDGFWNRGFLTPNTPGAGALLDANGFPAALASGASIGPGGQFGQGREYGLMFTYGPLGHGNKKRHRGNFDFGQANNFGFRFTISGETHYGWVRLGVTFGRGLDGITTIIHVLEYAYETDANTAIPAGSCTVAGNPKTATSLGALALGAQGLPLWRRK